MSEVKKTTPAPATAKPVAVAATGAMKPTEAAKNAMTVSPKGKVRAEVQILTRLADKNAADSLYNVILQLTGGDKLFVDKFAMCCKAQVERHWKYDGNAKKWTNPFLVIPVNSQLDALYKCASRKILPDGYNCNLIPYLGRDEKRVDVSIDFKGLIDTATKEGIILDCDAKEVCEADIFKWSLGDVTDWTFDPRRDRGRVCGYCAWAVLPNGRKKWTYMSMEEIAAVRKCAKTQLIWNKWEGEMCKKTVIRRLFKTLPNTPKLVAMMELDNEAFDMEADAGGRYEVKRGHTSPVRQVAGNVPAALPAPAPEPEATAEDGAEESAPTPEPIPVQAEAVQPAVMKQDLFD